MVINLKTINNKQRKSAPLRFDNIHNIFLHKIHKFLPDNIAQQ